MVEHLQQEPPLVLPVVELPVPVLELPVQLLPVPVEHILPVVRHIPDLLVGLLLLLHLIQYKKIKFILFFVKQNTVKLFLIFHLIHCSIANTVLVICNSEF